MKEKVLSLDLTQGSRELLQKERIEELKKEISDLKDICMKYKMNYDVAKAEIERLRSRLGSLGNENLF